MVVAEAAVRQRTFIQGIHHTAILPCCRNRAATLPAARAYIGQRANIPLTPNSVSVSVVALMNVATSAHITAAEAA